MPDTALGLSTKFGFRGETYEFRASPVVFGHVGPDLSALVAMRGMSTEDLSGMSLLLGVLTGTGMLIGLWASAVLAWLSPSFAQPP